MTTNGSIERQVHLELLASLCQALLLTWSRATLPEGTRKELGSYLSGECVQCGLRVSGGELIEGAIGLDPSPKAARLKQGYCARRGCNSYYYRLSLSEAPGLDWASLLRAAEACDLAELTPTECGSEENFQTTGRWQWVASGIVLLALILGLVLARQWYRGGTIPFLREGEHFQVDRSPSDDASF